jgi:hypothetical protein
MSEGPENDPGVVISALGGSCTTRLHRAARMHFAVIARSDSDEAIQLSVSPHESWIASLRSQRRPL